MTVEVYYQGNKVDSSRSRRAANEGAGGTLLTDVLLRGEPGFCHHLLLTVVVKITGTVLLRL